jgi:hypothetical protein
LSREAKARITPEEGLCAYCGHRELRSAARPGVDGCVWVAYCPACKQIQEQASIPEWFLKGLPPPREVH